MTQSIVQKLRGKIKFFPSFSFFEAKDIELYMPVEPIIPNIKSGVLYIRKELSGYLLYWIVDESWYLIKETHSNAGRIILKSKCGLFKNYTKKEFNALKSNYDSLTQEQRYDFLKYSFYFAIWKRKSKENREFLKFIKPWKR